MSLPEKFYRPPGLAGEIYDWIESTAVRPAPKLTGGAVMSALGAAIGRRYRGATGLRTNIYVLGVAPSGSGKNHARSKIRQLFHHAAIGQRHLASSSVSSEAAIYSLLEKRPSCLGMWDEAGDMFAALSSLNAQSYEMLIMKAIKALFSEADGVAEGKDYAKSNVNQRTDLVCPNLCLYMTTTERQFWNGVTNEKILDGFLSRLILIEQRDEYKAKKPSELIHKVKGAGDDIMYRLANQLTTIYQDSFHDYEKEILDWDNMEGLPGTRDYEHARTVYPDKGGEEWLDKQFDIYEENCKADPIMLPLWRRALEHIQKMALILAVVRDPKNPVMRRSDFAWARPPVDESINRIIQRAEGSMGESENERDSKAIEVAIRRAPISRTQLLRTHRKFRAADIDRHIKDLEEMGVVQLFSRRVGERGVATTFVAAKSYQLDHAAGEEPI